MTKKNETIYIMETEFASVAGSKPSGPTLSEALAEYAPARRQDKKLNSRSAALDFYGSFRK